jgi:integrase
VADWFRTWLNTIAPLSASDSTIETVYRPRVENWIVPRIGKHRLDRLRPEHLDALYVDLARAGLAPKTVLMVHQIISRALKMAVRRQIITVNVATLIDSPSHRSVEIEPLQQEDARAILAASKDVRSGARWSVAFGLGLRQSEALGMRWRYVDLEKGVIRVFQLKRRRFQHGCADPRSCAAGYHTASCARDCTKHGRYCPDRIGGDWTFREPKNGKTRFVPIPPPLIPILKAHKAAQAAEQLTAGDQWEDWDLVFAQPDGRPINPRRDWDEWKKLLKAAGIRDARPHDARHTAATLLLEQGVDIRVVQELMGHSSLAVTKIYAHVTNKLAKDAADRIGKALWV